MNKKILRKAIKDYERLCKLFNGKPYEECIKVCEEKCFDYFNDDDELFDINYGTACFTINNENGKAKVNDKSIELWNDNIGNYLGTYTLEEIRGELENEQ